VLSGVGLLLAIFSGCAVCNPWSFWIGLGLLILGIVFLLHWKKRCCLKHCAFLKEVILWVGSILLPLVATILGFAGQACLLILFVIPFIKFVFTFYLLVLILWAYLLAYYVRNCSKE